MYPTLYHLVFDLTGAELQVLKLINTFGLLVALAFLAAARILASELERRYTLGWLPSTTRSVAPPKPVTLFDVGLSALVAFVLGFKFFGVALGEYVLQGGSDTQSYLLSTQGHFWAGVVTGVVWGGLRSRDLPARQGAVTGDAAPSAKAAAAPTEITLLPQDHTLGITGAAALGGLLGAKVFHWLERPSTIIDLFTHPSLSALFSGLTIYGGLIVGALFVYGYCRRASLSFEHVADSVAPGLMLAYGIGRLGCQLAGDGDWGIHNTAEMPAALSWLPSWIWSFDYPNNVLGAGVSMAEGGFPGYGTHLVPPVYPTPLYETLMAFACFGLLWAIRKRVSRPLVMFGVYLLLNGVERFWIEKIRVNATYDLLGYQITQAEIISVFMMVAGLVLLWLRQWKARPPDKAQDTCTEH